MTDSTLATGAFAEVLAARASANLGRTTTTRTAAVILVGILHLLMIAALLVVETIPVARKGAPPAPEIQLVLAPAHPAALPRVIEAKPKEQRNQFEEVEPQPITILPPQLETPKAPVDIMRALGAELACGASHYEYLNPVERKLCHKAPWELPDMRAIAIAPPPEPLPGHMSGAEAAARERAQAPACPPDLHTPCIDEVIYGKGPH